MAPPVRRWVPQANLSSSLSLAFTGGPVGIVTALVVAPPLIGNLGWQSVFWLCGASGLAWVAWWHPTVPEQPPALVAAYTESAIPETAPPKPDASQLSISDVPWGGFATNVPVLALLGVHCSANAGAGATYCSSAAALIAVPSAIFLVQLHTKHRHSF